MQPTKCDTHIRNTNPINIRCKYRCYDYLDLIVFPGTLDTLAVFRIKTSVVKVTEQTLSLQLFTRILAIFLAETVNDAALILVFSVDKLDHRVDNGFVLFVYFIGKIRSVEGLGKRFTVLDL